MAHGLALRMKDMLEQNNERLPIMMNSQFPMEVATKVSDDVVLIQAWINATHNPKNTKAEYISLLRDSLLLILSKKWDHSRKEDLLCAYTSFYKKFSTIAPNCTDVYNAVLKIAGCNWKNYSTTWTKIFGGNGTLKDTEVLNYFKAEPEEIVVARIHSLCLQSHHIPAYELAKLSVMYHCRITQDLISVCERRSSDDKMQMGIASIDWFAFLLINKFNSQQIITELAKAEWKCHEGIAIICRLRKDPTYLQFRYKFLKILLMTDLTLPSQYCCTRKLFMLFCSLHKEMNSSPSEVSEKAREIFTNHAPSSSHLYLFVDVMWETYGIKCLDFYVEMYVRALTADINHLEAKKNSESTEDVLFLETHLATVFDKLSTLFKGFLDLAARECMFSAFSLRPTNERLCILQSLTQNLLSVDKNQEKSLTGYEVVATNCNCRVKCDGPCKMKSKDYTINPLLNLGIKNVSYRLIKDLVSILENTRSMRFQYNFFSWKNNSSELEEYLLTYNTNKLAGKDSGSDTEVASEGSGVSDDEDPNPVLESQVKKKDTCDPMSALDVAANIEVGSNDGFSKKLKTLDQVAENERRDILETSRQHPQSACNALETLIRATLSNNTPKGQSSHFMISTKTSNETFRDSISTQVSEVNRQSTSNTVHPYSLTDHGKRENLGAPSHLSNKSIMKRIKSSVESKTNFMTHYSDIKSPASSTASSLIRQSVVVNPSINTSDQRPTFQQQVQKALPYSIQSPVYRQVKVSDSFKMQNITENAAKESALNLTKSDSHSDMQQRKFYPQTSQYVSYQPPPPILKSNPPGMPSRYPNLPSTANSFNSKQISLDRNSVIQHTMQHARDLPLSREVLVSLDSSEIKKLRESNESDVKINLKDKIHFNPAQLSVGTLIINRNPIRTCPTSSQSNLIQNEKIAIPGIVSSPTPGNQTLQFTKLTKRTTITSSVKKVYHKPYVRTIPVGSNPESELVKNLVGTPFKEKGTIKVYKPQQSIMGSPSSGSKFVPSSSSLVLSNNQNKHWGIEGAAVSEAQTFAMRKAVSSINQPNVGPSINYNSQQQLGHNHPLDSVNKTFTPHPEISRPHSVSSSSNQAWYSKPYPQPTVYNADSASLTRNTVTTVHNTATSYSVPNSSAYPENTASSSLLKSRLSSGQVFSSIRNTSNTHSNKGIATYSKSFDYAQNSQGHPSSLSYVPTSTAASSSYSSSFSAYQRPGQPEECHNVDFQNSSTPSTNRQNVFQATNSAHPMHSLHSSSASSSKACCSAVELNPCQTCSPTVKERLESTRPVQQEFNFNPGVNPQRISGDNPPVASHESTTEVQDLLTECTLCGFSIPASLMEMHLEESHPNMQLDENSYESGNKEPFRMTSKESSEFATPFVSNFQDQQNHWPSVSAKNQTEQNLLKDTTSSENFTSRHIASFNSDVSGRTTMLDSEFFDAKQSQTKLENKQVGNVSKASIINSKTNFERSVPQTPNKMAKTDISAFCNICNKQLCSKASLRRHNKAVHNDNSFTKPAKQNINEDTSSSMILKNSGCESSFDYSPLSNKSNSTQPSQLFELDSSLSGNLRPESYHSNPTQNPSMHSNPGIEMNSELQSDLSNDQINKKVGESQTEKQALNTKRSLKGSTKPCQYCGKILTVLYMKLHILKKHSEVLNAQDTNLSQDLSSVNNDSKLGFQSVSTLLQEDIDSRTCLSPSDALSTNGRFNMEACGAMSDSSVKIAADGAKFPTQASNSDKRNALPKSSAKFKVINKALPMTLKQEHEDAFTGENELQSKVDESYRCHVCFRKYTSKNFLNKHLQNYHKLPIPPDSITSQRSSEITVESTFSEYKQDSQETLVKEECELNSMQPSLTTTESNVQIKEENYDQGNATYTFLCNEQGLSTESKITNSESSSQFSESEMQKSPNMNSNKGEMLNSNKKQTAAEKMKQTKPKNFKCLLCVKEFSYSKNLVKHMEKYHSNNLSQESSTGRDSVFQIENEQEKNVKDHLNLERFDKQTHGNELTFNLNEEMILNNGSYSSSDKVSLSKSDSFFNSTGCSSEDFADQNDLSGNIEKHDTNSYSEKSYFRAIHTNPSTDGKLIVSTCSSYNENVLYDGNDQNESNAIYSTSNDASQVIPKSKLFTDMLKDSLDTNDPYQTNSLTTSSSQSMMQTISPVYVQQSNINLETSSVSTESNECPVCFKKLSTQDQLQHHIEKLHPLSSDPINHQQVNSSNKSENQNMFSELQYTYPDGNFSVASKNSLSEGIVLNSSNRTNEGLKEYPIFLSSSNQLVLTDENEKNKHELLLSELCNNNNFSNLDRDSFKDLHCNENPFTHSTTKESFSSTAAANFSDSNCKGDFTESQMDNNRISIHDASSLQARKTDNDKPMQKCDIFSIDPITMADDSTALKHALMFSELLDEFEAHTAPSVPGRNEYEQLSSEKDIHSFSAVENSSLVGNFLSSQSQEMSDQNILNDFLEKTNSVVNDGLPSTTMQDIFSDKYIGEKPSSSRFQYEKQDNLNPSSFPNLNNFLAEEIQKCDSYIPPFSSHMLTTGKHGKAVNELSLASNSFVNKELCAEDSEKVNMQQFFESDEIAKEFSLLLHSNNENTTPSYVNLSNTVCTKKTSIFPHTEESSFINNGNRTDNGSFVNNKKMSINPKSNSSEIIDKKKKLSIQGEHACSVCSKKFVLKCSLKTHVLKQHPADALSLYGNTSKPNDNQSNKKHACFVCTKELCSSSGLRRHMINVHPEVPFIKVVKDKKLPVTSKKPRSQSLNDKMGGNVKTLPSDSSDPINNINNILLNYSREMTLDECLHNPSNQVPLNTLHTLESCSTVSPVRLRDEYSMQNKCISSEVHKTLLIDNAASKLDAYNSSGNNLNNISKHSFVYLQEKPFKIVSSKSPDNGQLTATSNVAFSNSNNKKGKLQEKKFKSLNESSVHESNCLIKVSQDIDSSYNCVGGKSPESQSPVKDSNLEKQLRATIALKQLERLKCKNLEINSREITQSKSIVKVEPQSPQAIKSKQIVSTPLKSVSLKHDSCSSLKSPTKCRACSKVFRTQSNLACHLKKVHGLPFIKKENPCASPVSTKLILDKVFPDLVSDLSTASTSKHLNEKGGKGPKEIADDVEIIDYPTKCQKKVKHLSSNQSADEKNTMAKDNFIKRRSQRSSSCEIIDEIIVQKIDKGRKQCSYSRISSTPDKKRFQKAKNRCPSRKKSVVTFTNKTTKKTPNVKQSTSKSSIPKCIIKVCKDEQNSVFYKSLNDNENSYKHLNNKTKKVTTGKSRVNVKKKNSLYKHRKKRHTVLLSNLRSRRRLKMSNSALSICTSSKPKNKKLKGRVNSMQKGNQNDETFSAKNTLLLTESENKYPVQTFKKPEDIERFLIEHKQPKVHLQRITNASINVSDTVGENSACSLFQFKRVPIVRLTRIDAMKSVSVIESKHDPEDASTSAHYPIDSSASEELISLKEKKSETIPLQEETNCSTKPGIEINAEFLGSSKSTSSEDGVKKESISIIKECSVLLNKLPFL